MIVRCIANDLKPIKSVELVTRLRKYIHLSGPDNDLVIGNKYTVQAIGNRDGYWWYYIHTVDVNDYPYPYPSEYFEVINNLLPIDWAVKIQLEKNQCIIRRIAFPEWANDDMFYENLVNDDPICKKIYRRYFRQ